VFAELIDDMFGLFVVCLLFVAHPIQRSDYLLNHHLCWLLLLAKDLATVNLPITPKGHGAAHFVKVR